tara:strand:+ start:4279 stop:4560 length:282 start_codon:yes stop_codon:yes gene_type:complete
MDCKGKTGQALADCKEGIKFTLFATAREGRNKHEMVDIRTPATARDSTAYREGFRRGLRGDKPSAMELKYQGEGPFSKMGRWEGQNNPLRKKK